MRETMGKLTQRIAELSPEKRALLARRLQQARGSESRPAVISRRPPSVGVPLSYGQQRLWFLSQWEPESAVYNIPAAVRLTGRLNVEALSRSLSEVVRRHEALRAVFSTVKGEPVQEILPAEPVALPVVDLQGIDEAQREAEALRLAEEEARRPFDLRRGPLLRACLLRLRDDDQILVLTMHHIVSDGTSVNVLIQEMTALYQAFSAGQPSPLPELPIQYADFAYWQRERLQGETLDQQLDYWRQRLAGSPPLVSLPIDHPRPALLTHRGARHIHDLPPSLFEAFQALAQREGVTLFMALLAAFSVFMHRYSGEDEINIGTPVAGRNHAEVEALIGFFVNTLVMRTDLSGEPSFRDLLARVREVALGAYAHQDLPFEMLVEALQPQRDLNYTPLFQVMLHLSPTPLEAMKLPDLNLELIWVHPGTSQFDLTLLLEQSERGARVHWTYNTDLFEASTIEQMARHFHTLLDALLAQPLAPLSSLPLLLPDERDALLRRCHPRASFPSHFCLHHRFQEIVRRFPHAPALSFEGQHLSYDLLNRRANQLAHLLLQHDVRPDTLVGICLDRSFDLIVALLAVLKAGAAYLPLDPSYPQQRLAFMLDDAQVPLVLTHAALRDRLPHDGSPAAPRLLCLDADAAAIAQQPDRDPVTCVTPDHLAYCIYTSGSTGRPKGVLVSHRNVARLFTATDPWFGFDERQVWTLFHSIAFDFSVWEVWGALLYGGRLVVAPYLVSRSPEAFYGLLEQEQVTVLNQTPSAFGGLAEVAGRRGVERLSLRWVIFGGEALEEERLVGWWAVQGAGGPRLVNMYGITETTVHVTYREVRAGEGGVGSGIGEAIPDLGVYVLDERGEPAPVGVWGELYVGGAGVARGYLNRPELTGERFVANRFGEGVLYRTGDRGRYRWDGKLEYGGRVDEQVKVRGFRIEPGEIAAALVGEEGVREAAVVAREEAGGEKRLVAYVVGSEEGAASGSELRRRLKEKLPEYLVPAAIVFVEALPLTANGKLDRKALPAPEPSRPELDVAYVPPRNAVERYLAGIWQEVLRLDRVGAHDNFFELGGDSLRAAIVTNRLQEELQIEGSVKAIFIAPTIADLAGYLREYYAEAVAALGGAEAEENLPLHVLRDLSAPASQDRVDAAKLALMRRLITPLPPRARVSPKNPPAVFVLSPPRSGSTLLRAMLAGHPHLFAPPELDLLSFNTLRERRDALSGERRFWLQAPIRAIMEIHGCDADQAERIMADFEEQDLTTQQFYRRLQEWIGDRLLVDKTPVYALDPAILDRAEEEFDRPLYIHLTRHPYATIYSFVEAKMEDLFFRHQHAFSLRHLAELVWIVSHQNILEFFQRVPSERAHRVRFEELVSEPERVLRDLSRFLGIEFYPDMLRPYEGRRMTDGVRPGAQMVGDLKFTLRREIDANSADRWRKHHREEFLSEIAGEVSQALGYVLPDEPSVSLDEERWDTLRPIPRDGDLPLSFSQQRLWFLEQLEPGTPLYNVPDALRLTGRLDVAALERSLREVVQRHEVLRTTFSTIDGRPVPVIAPTATLTLPVVDLCELPAAEREPRARQLLSEEARRPFGLAQGPLLRALLLRLGDAEHILVVVLHHIVADGWSSRVIAQELATLYAAFAAGQPSPLPPLPIQYVDFAHWQRHWLNSKLMQSQLEYWARQLTGSPPVLELPIDRPRPAVQSFRGARHSFTLSRDLSDALRAIGRSEGATLHMTLLAAFQTLLFRYTGQTDLCVGTPVACRNRNEIEGLVGCFVNTLVLRADLADDPTFRELLRRVREVAVGAYANQDLPFEMLVDALQPQRDMSHTPLSQVAMVLQDAPREGIDLPGLRLTPLEADSGTAKFDLTLSVLDRSDGLRMAFEYNTDLFEASTIEQMARHFHTLLDALLAQPLAPLSSLPLLLPDERDALLRRCHPRASFPSHFCLHHRFQEIVRRFPHAPALSFEGQHLSYDLLNRRANQLAHLLLQHDVRPDTLVGICLDRSFDLIVALLAVLKAGAAYLPLDPSYPQQRLAFMLDDAQVPLVLTHAALRDRLPHDGSPTAPRLLCLDADAPAIAQQPDRDPVTCVTPDHLAYCIYTSGSTGRPKGVLVSHRNVARLFTATDPWFGFDERQVWTLFHSIAFDFSVWEVWGALLYGGRLVVAPYLVSRSPEAFYGLLEQEQVTVLNQTPSAFGGLAEVAGRRGVERLSLRWVIFGGEALEEERLVGWWAVQGAGGPRLVNMYGITETTVHVTCREVRAGEGGVGSGIGEAIPDLGVYVLDERGEPAPVGVWGELYVGGAGVARGYLNRPELTGERFVANRFGEGVLYRTGDRGRYRWDGKLEYGGRVDEQVKVRGFRIEPGEIAAALVGEEGVREAAVVAREEAGGEKRLVAYVVGSEEGAASGSELRRRLKEKLPEYLVPAAIVFVEALPLTANGKLDRKALPAPESARPELETPYRPPTSPAEVTLASIWGEVLGLERVGVEDNFFELGGDSILSIQVIARANQAGLGLTPRQLFEHPTIAGLASVANRDAPVEAEQGLVTGPAPLTPIQRWFFEQEPPDPHHWNQALLLEIDRQIDPARLEEAVAALLVHHDALRLRFRRAPHGWEAENAGLWAGAALERIDLSGVGSAQQAAAIEAAAEGVQRSLELGSGRLLRAAWMDLGAGRGARLLLVCHHLAIDAVSWRILLEDLQRLIGLEAEGGTVELPAKTTSYQEWARRLEAYARSGEAEAERGYWEEVVRGSEGWQVPVAEPAGENGEAWGERVVVGLEAEETKALVRGVRAGSGAGVQEALLWALGEVLGEWTGAERVWVEVEGHGREERFEGVDVTRTVGWFTTIYPVRLEVGGGGRVEERLERVKEQVRGVPGGGLGYGVLRYLGGEGGVGGLERWRGSGVCLNYLGQVAGREGGGVLRGAKEGVGRSRSEGGERRHEVSVTGVIVEGRLKVEWGYSERRQRREEMEGLAEAYVRKLRELIAASGGGGEEEQEEGTEFAEVRLSPSELETLVNEVS